MIKESSSQLSSYIYDLMSCGWNYRRTLYRNLLKFLWSLSFCYLKSWRSYIIYASIHIQDYYIFSARISTIRNSRDSEGANMALSTCSDKYQYGETFIWTSNGKQMRYPVGYPYKCPRQRHSSNKCRIAWRTCIGQCRRFLRSFLWKITYVLVYMLQHI